jgi:hypothetical protein
MPDITAIDLVNAPTAVITWIKAHDAGYCSPDCHDKAMALKFRTGQHWWQRLGARLGLL